MREWVKCYAIWNRVCKSRVAYVITTHAGLYYVIFQICKVREWMNDLVSERASLRVQSGRCLSHIWQSMRPASTRPGPAWRRRNRGLTFQRRRSYSITLGGEVGTPGHLYNMSNMSWNDMILFHCVRVDSRHVMRVYEYCRRVNGNEVDEISDLAHLNWNDVSCNEMGSYSLVN